MQFRDPFITDKDDATDKPATIHPFTFVSLGYNRVMKTLLLLLAVAAQAKISDTVYDDATICQRDLELKNALMVLNSVKELQEKGTAKEKARIQKQIQSERATKEKEIKELLATYEKDHKKKFDMKNCQTEASVRNTEVLYKRKKEKSSAATEQERLNESVQITSPQLIEASACQLQKTIQSLDTLPAEVPKEQITELKAKQKEMKGQLEQMQIAYSNRYKARMDLATCPPQ